MSKMDMKIPAKKKSNYRLFSLFKSPHNNSDSICNDCDRHWKSDYSILRAGSFRGICRPLIILKNQMKPFLTLFF